VTALSLLVFKPWMRIFAALSCLLLVACASGPNANPIDPFEPFNRGVYKFNDGLDRNVLKPVAVAYKEVTPSVVQKGVGNFFGNLQDLWSFVNNVLQFKAEAAANSLVRVTINTTVGIVGLIDVASEWNVKRHTEDFGQTLGYWGVGAGPYLVLPLLGPSTLRDTAALPVDFRGDLVTQSDNIAARNSLSVVRIVDRRARLLRAGQMVDEVALDNYAFLRDAYLQRRRNDVFDGNPPDEAEPADLRPSK
jgi:phospholipid-binding lipoprotein MlaA